MKPNLFLFYVSNVKRSTEFYSDLFDLQPKMETPQYVTYEIAPGVLFALWSGRYDKVKPSTPRTSEVGIMLPKSKGDIDELFLSWKDKATTVVEEPHDEGFGKTFVIADPDGNLIRVSPFGN